MHARVRSPNSLLILYQIINKPDFPSLANEIAEPRPDMNIKVTAFTVNEKSINTFWKHYNRLVTNDTLFSHEILSCV